MSELKTRLLPHTMKPEEIAGDADTKHRRVVELVRWMVRYNEGLRAHFCPTMQVGATVQHPDGYPVKVLSGSYLDPVYGRVSNWWTWQRINDDGTLGEKTSGYGWRRGRTFELSGPRAAGFDEQQACRRGSA